MLRVGHSKIPLPNGGTKILDYLMVEVDEEGFADSSKYSPLEYDLLYLITDQGKRKNGWWCGNSYYSHRLHPDENVIAWKKNKDML
jgi:hypothetical protein